LTFLEDNIMRSCKVTMAAACILGILLFAGGIVEAAPVNDKCSNATPIEEVVGLAFDTSSATFDGPGLCMTSANIWYRYIATTTGEMTINTCGSQFDTKLAVYSGSACYPTSSRLLACNDDACDWQSAVTINVSAGSSYLIEIGGYGSHKGQGVLNFLHDGIEPLLNDNCQYAEETGEVVSLSFDTTNATFDGPGLCVRGPNLWYVYTPSCTGQATISTCGSSFDTVLAVYSSTSCPPQQSKLIACNDDSDSCGQQAEVKVNVQAGNRYLIEVGGFNNLSKGPGVLKISCGGGEQPSPFDLGDAPDSSNNYSVTMLTYPTSKIAHFPTVFDDGTGTGPYGPIHLNPTDMAFLGNRVSREGEADIGPDQDAVNNITPLLQQNNQDGADDGVVFPINMPNGQWATFQYTVNVVTPNTDMYVNVWCDWNRDGDWNDDSTTNPTMISTKGNIDEWAVQNQLLFNLPNGLHELTTPAFLCWHPESGPENIWMRITLSEQPWKGGSGAGGSGPQEGYDFGETEDYYFVPEMTCSICEDKNGDGIINMNDLVMYVNQWLANCQ
jgi:hypothetical protein